LALAVASVHDGIEPSVECKLKQITTNCLHCHEIPTSIHSASIQPNREIGDIPNDLFRIGFKQKGQVALSVLLSRP
jgi:hypothetical protein